MVNTNLKKIAAGATVAAVAVALTATGALGEFIRLGTPKTDYSYGYGYETVNGMYGYGYGYGDQISSGGNSSSGGGTGGAAGLLIPAKGSTTPNADNNAITNQSDIATGKNSSAVNNLKSCPNEEFKDVQTNWAKEYINHLGQAGVVNGVSECMYEPSRNVTRAEFLKMTLNIFGYNYTSADAANEMFADVADNTWIANVVGKGKSLGVVDGYSATEFKPNASISRAEAMKMVLNTAATKYAQFGVDKSVVTSRYTDLADTWQAKYLEKATDLGIVNGDKDANGNFTNTFRPNDSITRAESAKVIARSSEVK